MDVRVVVLSEPVRRLLRHMTAAHPHAVAKALTRVALDVREAEAVMTARAFDFWSATTRTFIASPRSFPFTPATSSRMWSSVSTSAKAKVSDILVRQEFGFTLNPSERLRLTLGRTVPNYAVPTDDRGAQLRNARGRVSSKHTPAALLASKGGGFAKFKKRRRRKKGQGTLGTHVFINPKGTAILEKKPGGGGVRVLYGLYDQPIKVEPHLEFFDTARAVVGRVLLPKVTREMEKAMGGFGAR